MNHGSTESRQARPRLAGVRKPPVPRVIGMRPGRGARTVRLAFKPQSAGLYRPCRGGSPFFFANTGGLRRPANFGSALPGLHTTAPRIVTAARSLRHVHQNLVRQPLGMARQPPGFVRRPPGFVRRPPGFVRQPPVLARQVPVLARQVPVLARQHQKESASTPVRPVDKSQRTSELGDVQSYSGLETGQQQSRDRIVVHPTFHFHIRDTPEAASACAKVR
jgi:hypothetical protein